VELFPKDVGPGGLFERKSAVLDGIFEIKNLEFTDLKSKLKLRFGEGHLAQTYYTQFTNRRQKVSKGFGF